MKKIFSAFSTRIVRALIFLCGFSFLFSAGCVSPEGIVLGAVESDDDSLVGTQSESDGPRSIFPSDRAFYSEAQSWRTENPDPLMVELRNGDVDKLRQKNVDEYIGEVAKVINENAKNDFHKVKLINDIIVLTLDYDVDSYMSRKIPRQKYSDVLPKGRAVCDGFSAVFYKLCEETGIKCRYVRGYARGASVSLEKESSATLMTNHAWNIVTIDERDYLLDVTWNEGHITDGKPVKEYSTAWLFAYPEAFVCTHFPDNASDQLLEKTVSRTEFLNRPGLRPYFFDEVESWTGDFEKLVAADNGTLSYDFAQINKDVKFTCTVKSVDDSKVLENAHHFVQELDSPSKFLLSFPEAGNYKVQLFANHPEKTFYLGEFLVNAKVAGNVKFPKTFSNYGIANAGMVEAPVLGPLKKGTTVSFAVRTSRSFVAVLINDSAKEETSWNYLENKGDGLFVGNVAIPETATRVRVNVKEPGGRNFWSIAEYELE